jgi:hypothetical protein
MKVEGNNISFSLDGTEFAEGKISESGQNISIEANKQVDLDYTKAYNSARINLEELLHGEDAQIMMEELKSESLTSAEQVSNMEDWLSKLKNNELSESSFNFMSGGQKEKWIEQLAEVEGVSKTEMEEMIKESYQEITGNSPSEIKGLQESIELNSDTKRPMVDWVEKLEENLDKVKEGKLDPEEFREILENKPESGDVYDDHGYDFIAESYEGRLSEITNEVVRESSSSVYELKGHIDVMDRLNFYDNFTDSFEIEVDTTTEITETLINGDISPEEFISWLETDAFDKEIVFDGTENPPREHMKRKISLLVDGFKRALQEDGIKRNILLDSIRKGARMQIDQMMLYGK